MENDSTPSAEAVTAARKPALWVIILAFALLIGFMALIAWGLRRSMSGPIRVGDVVPPITMTTFEGTTLASTDYRGKVIVLNFWASWCKPCEQEAAELEEAWQLSQDADDVIFLGLAWTDTPPNAKQYLEKFAITYPNGPDLRTQVSQMFRIRGVPETYIIGMDGRLKHAQVGPFESTAQIMQLIAEARGQ